MMMNIVDKLTARELPIRSVPVRAVILHTTGSPKLEAVLRFYDDVDGLQPHYCVGWDGTVYRIAEEDRVAYHCAILPNERLAYQSGFAFWSQRRWDSERGDVVQAPAFPGYQNWIDTWRPKFESPLDFVTGAHPNTVSIGIELLQPENAGPDIFTDEQYDAASKLAADIAARHGIQWSRERILGHQDVSPMRRCNGKGAWDPGAAFSWMRLMDE